VVTSESNSVEETAYFLNLTFTTDIPVALTAAQRNHDTIGNDGDLNLFDAVRIAAAEESRGRGAMVVLNDKIQDSRDTTKAASGRPDAWTSANLGVLGQLDKRGELQFHRRAEAASAPETEFDLDGVDPDEYPTVEVVYSHVGAGPELVDAAAEHADGVVVAGFATGSPASSPDKRGQRAALEALAESGPPSFGGTPSRHRRRRSSCRWHCWRPRTRPRYSVSSKPAEPPKPRAPTTATDSDHCRDLPERPHSVVRSIRNGPTAITTRHYRV